MTHALFNGQYALTEAQARLPRFRLTFYEDAIIAAKYNINTGTVQEYPVTPAAVASTLAPAATFTSGFITNEVLYIAQRGAMRHTLFYREPQLTGIWLEGHADPLRIPMPPLLMLREYDGSRARYAIFAVKARPTDLRVTLYNAPMPNVTGSGSCWGTVPKPPAELLKENSAQADWEQWFGSSFGGHQCRGKSLAHPDDIRNLYPSLKNEHIYPLDDLIPLNNITLERLL